MTPRKNYPKEFKARVALEAIREQKTIAELSSEYEVHSTLIARWKKDALDKTVDQFTMAIEPNPAGGGVLKMMWENTQFSVPFTVKK